MSKLHALRADSMDNWTQEELRKQAAEVDTEMIKIQADADPGLLRIKNVGLTRSAHATPCPCP